MQEVVKWELHSLLSSSHNTIHCKHGHSDSNVTTNPQRTNVAHSIHQGPSEPSGGTSMSI